jgi:hypothetical protein
MSECGKFSANDCVASENVHLRVGTHTQSERAAPLNEDFERSPTSKQMPSLRLCGGGLTRIALVKGRRHEPYDLCRDIVRR